MGDLTSDRGRLMTRVYFVTIAATLLLVPAHAAWAQVEWDSSGTPIFRSHRSAPTHYREPATRREAPAHRGESRHRQRYVRYPAIMSGGGQPDIQPVAPEKIDFPNALNPGEIIIDTRARKLYYTLSNSTAYAYPISVGREGFKWYGTEKISRIQAWPSWTPPAEMRQRQPYLPVTMKGGVRNPLGAKAIYLGQTLYRIHGTNDPKSIGRAASSGCFRMMNKHVLHLAGLVHIGTIVHVVRNWKGSAVSAKQKGGQPDNKS